MQACPHEYRSLNRAFGRPGNPFLAFHDPPPKNVGVRELVA